MKKAHTILVTALLIISSVQTFAEEIILRLQPEATAPAITRILATEKVLLEAAPAGQSSDWRQLELKVPFDGYVPAAALTKGFAIVQNTPVHFLPDAGSYTITRAKDGDLYEIVRVKDEWATVRYNKELTTYFRGGVTAAASTTPTPATTPAPAPKMQLLPEPPMLDLSISAPTHSPKPQATAFDPKLSVGITSPEDLPPENVVWRSAPSSLAATPKPKAQRQAEPVEVTPPKLPGGIMVGPAETQAREPDTLTTPEPDLPLRLLVGTLVREINTSRPAYPIRLYSAEGRLIAYVDLSGMFIEDLSPYLDQRVYLRGQINPVRASSRDLVIFVHQILPAN